uniref:Uncharacterized protein n=1 Tax=Meloidogyne enterolobii TaxID=390850 RepID=A0A6V7UFA1_MELEN|nr:unnamed protein product [Meloidogyne enterolobii]
MSNISTTTKPSQLDAQHQNNNNNLTSPLSPSLMFPQGNNNGQSVKANMSSGSSPLETAATCSTGFFPQLLFPPTMIPSSSSTSSASSSSAFVSSSTPQNRLFPISSSTSGTNRSEFVASPITGQQQQYLNGDGNGGGLFGSNTILPPPPHQFSSLQQLQQQNLLFQRQQQQMQQSQQQHRHSPRLHHPFQHQPNPPQIDNHQQQLWFNLLSAIALGHSNGLPTASTSDLSQQQQQTIGGTDIRSLAAEKKLERDSDGNALCPACHEKIGKDSAQWAKHLDMERGKLQKAIQCLRERTAKSKISEAEKIEDINFQPNLFRKTSNGSCSGREALLDRVRCNQRRRMEAKLETQFLHHLTSSTTTSAPCTTDESVDSINTNSALNNTNNNVIDENRILESSNSDQMEWKQHSLPSTKFECKNETGTFTTKNEPNEDVSEQLETTTTCFSCQRISDCLVLNVRSKMVRCMECFQQKQQTLFNNTNNNNNENGFAAVLEGLQSIENKKKRISPPFSALELASSPGKMFGGTKRTRVESEH